MSTTPRIIGHRGAPGYRPEHTRSSYLLAIALGAELVEPDIVPTKDGVLIVRHENEISGTTDVADHPEFAKRRTTKAVDGIEQTGWFTEDFTWAELSTLRCRERLPQLRQQSSTFDDTEPILRLSDLLALLESESARLGRQIGLVAEVKHPTYFASVGFDMAVLTSRALALWNERDDLVVECFEQSVLTAMRARGLHARYVYLLDGIGTAPDLVARDGKRAVSYRDQLSPEGMAVLARDLQGISIPKEAILRYPELVDLAHGLGLQMFTWTLRPENAFLAKRFRDSKKRRRWGDWRGEFQTIMATGVDAVFADHPDLAVAARAGLPVAPPA